MSERALDGAWSPKKVAIVEKAFYSFAQNVRVNSKERGGNYPVAKHFYTSQKRFFHAVFHKALATDRHTVKVLKSRQLGVTTASEILDVFWLGFFDGIQGALIYDSNTHAASGRRRIENVLKSLPDNYRFPRLLSHNRDSITLENGSNLLIMSAGVRQTNSSGVLGRSEGLNYIHATEIRSWNNEEGIKSLQSSKSDFFDNRLYIWESTASGFNDWYEMWENYDDLDEIREFIGWWAKDDQRWKRSNPRFTKYGIDPPSDEEAKRIRAVKELYGFEIDQEQLAWYRWFVDPARERTDDEPEDSYLLSDQPWTESEAFQHSGSSFYRSDRLQQAVAAAIPVGYKSYRFWPGNSIIDCDFQQAQYIRETELKLWEEPAGECVYIVSGDPAFGRDENSDNSCAEVIRCFADGWDQVVEFASSLIEPHHFSWLLLSLVSYYATPPQNDVMMICELNGPGEEVWRHYKTTRDLIRDGYLRTQARQMGIGNVAGNVSSYVYTRSDSAHFGNSYQWKTNTQLKVQAMESLRNNFHNGLVSIRSVDALSEMKTIVREGDKIAAGRKGRDDRNFALAMANRAWEERKRSKLVRENRTRAADKVRRTASPVDRLALFNRNMLQDFFSVRQRQRQQARIAAMQRSRW
ncbi:MAG TPA: hypothetical protein VGR84_19035 [Candidatus Acidoferrales bacterium]|nr:hypothetical protein [Candidatus Acidoferrales bacterium]